MSVIIDNMSIPKRCATCSLKQIVNLGNSRKPNFQFHCPIVKRIISHVSIISNEDRPDDCKKLMREYGGTI